MGIKKIPYKIDWIKEFEDMYSAWNKEGENLGCLVYERVGSYMHWCWHQKIDIRMSLGRLEEVRNKQKQLIKERNLSKLKFSQEKKIDID